MTFARQIDAKVIIRGLRAVADFEYEFQMTAMNQQLDRDIETVFLMADPRHQAIASSAETSFRQSSAVVAQLVTKRTATRPSSSVAQRS